MDTVNTPLGTTAVFSISTGYTLVYLGALYIHPATRTTPPSSRDSPSTNTSAATPAEPVKDRNSSSVIKARLTAVSLSTTLCLSSLAFLPLPPHTSSLALLGLTLPSTLPQTLRLILLSAALTMSLFGGSIYVAGLRGILPGQRWYGTKGRDGEEFWQLVRNYGLGPVTEELVFRSCIIAVGHLAGFSKAALVFGSPLWFGLAHVHHAWETYVQGGRTKQSFQRGVFQSIFQFAYTTLFGWYASYLFLRTGSIIPPILAHIFCNYMGLPPIAWALSVFPSRRLSIWGTYGVGIASFVYGLSRMTTPNLFGGSIYWP